MPSTGRDVMLVRDKFEKRLTAVEEELRLQARLRAAVDRDVSDANEKLRGVDRLLQAVATTQGEHTAQLNAHTKTLNAHSETLQAHTKLLNVHTKLLNAHTGMLNAIADTLTSVGGQLADVKTHVSSMETRMSEMEGRAVGVDDKLDRIIAVLERPSQGG
jgi:chromosome segregation ATPase